MHCFLTTIFQGFTYRRIRYRVKPKLTEQQKASRLVRCLNNRNNNFEKCIYADESTIRLNEYLRYQLRLPSKNPRGIEGGNKYFNKINIFGAISCSGPSQFDLTCC